MKKPSTTEVMKRLMDEEAPGTLSEEEKAAKAASEAAKLAEDARVKAQEEAAAAEAELRKTKEAEEAEKARKAAEAASVAANATQQAAAATAQSLAVAATDGAADLTKEEIEEQVKSKKLSREEADKLLKKLEEKNDAGNGDLSKEQIEQKVKDKELTREEADKLLKKLEEKNDSASGADQVVIRLVDRSYHDGAQHDKVMTKHVVKKPRGGLSPAAYHARIMALKKARSKAHDSAATRKRIKTNWITKSKGNTVGDGVIDCEALGQKLREYASENLHNQFTFDDVASNHVLDILVQDGFDSKVEGKLLIVKIPQWKVENDSIDIDKYVPAEFEFQLEDGVDTARAFEELTGTCKIKDLMLGIEG